jgi:hypothetical protein
MHDELVSGIECGGDGVSRQGGEVGEKGLEGCAPGSHPASCHGFVWRRPRASAAPWRRRWFAGLRHAGAVTIEFSCTRPISDARRPVRGHHFPCKRTIPAGSPPGSAPRFVLRRPSRLWRHRRDRRTLLAGRAGGGERRAFAAEDPLHTNFTRCSRPTTRATRIRLSRVALPFSGSSNRSTCAAVPFGGSLPDNDSSAG